MQINFNVGTIYLIMGDACNLSCVYCSQHDIKENMQPKAEINNDLYGYLKKIRTEQEKSYSLIFYGGEPLLYFEQIKEIRHNLEGLDSRYSIITNGKLLTQEIVEYINANNIHIQLSWDGVNVTKTRGYDALADKDDLLVQINRLCLAGVMSGANYPYDFIQAVDKFDEKYFAQKKRHVMAHFDPVRNSCGLPGLTDNIDLAKWRGQMENLISDYKAYKEGKRKYSAGVHVVDKLLRRVGKINNRTNAARCGSGVSSLNMGVDGNIYACHNTRQKIGTIKSNHLSIIRNLARIDETPKICKEFDCANCSAFNYCCNCFVLSAQARRDYYCDMIRAIFEPILAHYDELKTYLNTPKKGA